MSYFMYKYNILIDDHFVIVDNKCIANDIFDFCHHNIMHVYFTRCCTHGSVRLVRKLLF